MVAPVAGSEPLWEFDDTRLFGTTGLNRFTGTFDGSFPVGPMAMTRMAGPPELMDQEDRLMANLHEADAIVVAEDGMMLSREGLSLIELQRSGTDRPTRAT